MPELVYEKRDHVAYLTLNRPEAMNSLSPVLSQELGEAWHDVANDEDVWMAVLTGAASDRPPERQSFCAGNDLKASQPPVLAEGEKPPSRAASMLKPGRASIMKGLDIFKPIIAAVNGYALGGGFEMMLACDIRIAADTAQLGLTEARIGSLPGGGGTQRLPRQIPYALAMYMLLTAERISAEEAYRIGLISKVVPYGELMDEAERLAGIMKKNGPLAMQAIKQSALRGLEMPLASGLNMESHFYNVLVDTDDRTEGRRAFAEKRDPVYEAR